jgi:predicted Zn-dependent protease
MRKNIVRLIVVLTLSLGFVVQAAPSQGAHRWLHLHWARSSNPFTLTYQANVSSTWSSLVSKVIGEWDNVAQYSPGTFDVVNFAGGPKLKIESGNYGPTGWFGIAEVTFEVLTGHIEEGSVKVNDYYFTGQYNTTVARDHVLCQEVGHILGLDHNNLSPLFGTSCMSDNNATLSNPAYQTPNAHDAQQLNAIYSHSDGSSLGLPLARRIIDIVPAG